MISKINLKYDPEKIQATSVSIKTKYSNYESCVSNIKTKINNTKRSWESESASSFFDKFNEIEEKSNSVSKEILYLSNMLTEVSGIYGKSQEDAKVTTEALPTEGVFLV